MKKVLQCFVEEVKKFTKANWWVYIVYVFIMTIILVKTTEKVASVFTVTTIHFIADIFIMMMISAYGRKQFRQGTYYQIISLLLFISIKVYSGLSEDGWHYISADPIFILAAVKNYYKDVKNKRIRQINFTTMLALSVVLIVTSLVLSRSIPEVNIFQSVPRSIQVVGIFLFAIALSVTDNERLRFRTSEWALLAMVVGSGWETVHSLYVGGVVAIALSYFLLPLTVLVYYMRDRIKIGARLFAKKQVENKLVASTELNGSQNPSIVVASNPLIATNSKN